MAQVTVRTNGQTLIVSSSVAHWTSAGLAVVASGDDDIAANAEVICTADYAMHFPNTATTATITVKQIDGTTIATYTGLQVSPGVGVRYLNPLPDDFMVAADASLPADLDTPATGEFTLPRDGVNDITAATSGQLVLTYFTARRTETVLSATVWTGGTAAAATPSVIRYAIYSIASDGAGTLINSTAHDAALLAAQNTAYNKAFSAAFAKVAGQRYAFGYLVVTAGAMPTLFGQLVGSSAAADKILAVAPRKTATFNSQADLPASFVAGDLADTRRNCITQLLTT